MSTAVVFLDILQRVDFTDNFKLMFNNVWESILNMVFLPFNLLPFSKPNYNDIEGAVIQLYDTRIPFYGSDGYFTKFQSFIDDDDNLKAYKLDKPISIKIAEFTISEYFNNYLDYEPYTIIEFMLPFYGSFNFETKKVMNKTIKIYYEISALDGACICEIFANNELIYTLPISIAVDIPITTTNSQERARNVLMQTLRTAGNIYDNLANSFEMVTNNIPIYGVKQTSGLIPYGTQVYDQPQVIGYKETKNFSKKDFERGTPAQNIANNVNGFINALQFRTKTGNVPNNGSLLNKGISPQLNIYRPVIDDYPEYNHIVGRPANYFSKLSELSGYTEIGAVHMDGFPNTTQPELDEIESLLKSGVIL